ncbi:AI-2E family transporter [Heyndrickxia vini]|uniref:AI-2E family transporter n=1 Tax=Heyndrickxia vini TaxID=1476025 RepID=A0ABX7E4W4_9BACI|nr:AI-2E family transporter [Heyndrickxia vini]QQZ10771.1 AI-2E family transporter [Heyndrickxia vini]
MLQKPRWHWLLNLGILLLLMIILYFFLLLKPFWMPILKIFLSAFIPLFIAAFFTYLLHPLVEKLHELGIHRGLATFLIYIVFFGGIGYMIYLGIPILIEQIKDLSDHIPEFANQYRTWVENLHDSTSRWPDGIQDQIEQRINKFEAWLSGFLSKAINSLMKIVNFIFILAIIPFLSFYLLKDIEKVKQTAWYFTPKRWRNQAKLMVKDADESIGGYIRGQLLVCLLVGTISTIAFWLIDIKYPVLLGLIVGITDIIPYFGPIIGAVPVAIIAATMSVKYLIYVLIIIVVLQFLEGNILSPLIVGKSLHMHPLFIILALTIGGEIGGVVGLIIAVPSLAILKVILIHVKNHISTNIHSQD